MANLYESPPHSALGASVTVLDVKSLVLRIFAAVFSLIQIVAAMGFITAGDFGCPIVFAASWFIPAIATLASGCLLKPQSRLLAISGYLNALGIMYLWIGYFFYPVLFYGKELTEIGAHTLFVSFASVLNLPPILCLSWCSHRITARNA